MAKERTCQGKIDMQALEDRQLELEKAWNDLLMEKRDVEARRYYLEKEDTRTAFGCIEYSHGLLDALRMIHGII